MAFGGVGVTIDLKQRASNIPSDLGDLNRCAQCGKSGQILPCLTGLGTHAWLHTECHQEFWDGVNGGTKKPKPNLRTKMAPGGSLSASQPTRGSETKAPRY